MDHQTAAKRITSIVEQRHEAQSRLDVFTEFGTLFETLEANRTDASTEPSELQQLGFRLLHVARDQLFLALVIQQKLLDIFRGCASALNEKNVLVAAYCARAAMEHVGSSAFFAIQASKLINSIANQQSARKINEALDKADKWNQRGYYGSTVQSNRENIEPIHINESIKALDDLASGTDFVLNCAQVYEELCQLVHPNHGSNLMVAEGPLGRGRLRATNDQEQAALTQIVEVCEATDHLSDQCRRMHTKSLVEVDDISKRAIIMQTSIAKAFALREPVANGSGKSLQDPLSFPKARSHFEEMRMLSEYFAERGISPTGERSLSRTADGKFVEKIVTTDGEICILYLRDNI